jgi:hypothetical protein
MFSVSAHGSVDDFLTTRVLSAEAAQALAEEYRCKRLHNVIVKDDTGRVLTDTALSGLIAIERHKGTPPALAH